MDHDNNNVITDMQITSILSKSYSNQTSRFLVSSLRGNNYIFILYHYDANSIHAWPLPNRQAGSIKKAWTEVYDLLKVHGEVLNLHILDNKCSDDLRKAFEKKTTSSSNLFLLNNTVETQPNVQFEHLRIIY